MKEREPRVPGAEFEYEVERTGHEIGYTDAEGRSISLYGEITAPRAGGRYPAVILCHGFNGHYTDFPEECRSWAARGYVCFTFDFCGAQAGGRSKGRTSEDYSLYTMKEDLRAAVAHLGTLDNVDGEQMFLFGGSQGGLVAALTAADDDIRDKIAAIAMYFPAFNIPDGWRGAPIRSTPLMGYSIGAGYISSLQDLDPFGVIGNFERDVCIVWGDRDAVVAREYIDGAVKAYGDGRVDLTVIPGAGHGFGGAALTAAVEKVLAFLEAHTLGAQE